MSKHFLLGLILASTVAMVGGAAHAADPTLHQVYAAAEAGKTTEALSMMDTVLRDHPNSGKAHYVEAELLAKAGRLSAARTEFATAERLAPGLPFAKPQAVQELKSRFTAPAATPSPLAAAPAVADSGLSSGMMLAIGGALVFLFFAARA